MLLTVRPPVTLALLQIPTSQPIQPELSTVISETQPLINLSLQLTLTASAFILFFAGYFSIRYGRAGLLFTHRVVVSICSAFHLAFTNAFSGPARSDNSGPEHIEILSVHELGEIVSASMLASDNLNINDSDAEGDVPEGSLQTSVS